jgi:hypothetical protein
MGIVPVVMIAKLLGRAVNGDCQQILNLVFHKKGHISAKEMWPCLAREIGGSGQYQIVLFLRLCIAFGQLGFVERNASSIERG